MSSKRAKQHQELVKNERELKNKLRQSNPELQYLGQRIAYYQKKQKQYRETWARRGESIDLHMRFAGYVRAEKNLERQYERQCDLLKNGRRRKFTTFNGGKNV